MTMKLKEQQKWIYSQRWGVGGCWKWLHRGQMVIPPSFDRVQVFQWDKWQTWINAVQTLMACRGSTSLHKTYHENSSFNHRMTRKPLWWEISDRSFILGFWPVIAQDKINVCRMVSFQSFKGILQNPICKAQFQTKLGCAGGSVDIVTS